MEIKQLPLNISNLLLISSWKAKWSVLKCLPGAYFPAFFFLMGKIITHQTKDQFPKM